MSVMASQLIFDRQAHIDTLEADGLVDTRTARRHAAALDAALRDAVVTRPVFDAAIADLRADHALLRQELKHELKTETEALRAELRSETAALRAELGSETKLLRQELKADIALAVNKLMTWGFAAIFAAVLANGLLLRFLK
jgi:hypothetical protein